MRLWRSLDSAERLVAVAALVLIPVLLYLALKPSKHTSNESVIVPIHDTNSCTMRSIIWFDDSGKPVSAKAYVCNEEGNTK